MKRLTAEDQQERANKIFVLMKNNPYLTGEEIMQMYDTKVENDRAKQMEVFDKMESRVDALNAKAPICFLLENDERIKIMKFDDFFVWENTRHDKEIKCRCETMDFGDEPCEMDDTLHAELTVYLEEFVVIDYFEMMERQNPNLDAEKYDKIRQAYSNFVAESKEILG